MFDSAIEVVAFVGVGVFMYNVVGSLEQIAKDLRIIAGRYDSKPPAEDPGQCIDA